VSDERKYVGVVRLTNRTTGLDYVIAEDLPDAHEIELFFYVHRPSDCCLPDHDLMDDEASSGLLTGTVEPLYFSLVCQLLDQIDVNLAGEGVASPDNRGAKPVETGFFDKLKFWR
jgi:hypothetical protein